MKINPDTTMAFWLRGVVKGMVRRVWNTGRPAMFASPNGDPNGDLVQPRTQNDEVRTLRDLIDAQQREIDILKNRPRVSAADGINAAAKAWDPDNAMAIVDALGNVAGKPINSLFKDYPYTMFASRHANYSPWLKDDRLAPYFREVNPPYLHGVRRSHDKGATIVDIYRCWTIWQIVTQLSHVKGDMVEVGAFRGGTAALIAHGIATANLDSHLYVCDTFKGVVKAGQYDNMYHGGEHSETTQDLVIDIVSRFLSKDRFSIKPGIFPDETGDFVDGRKFRFAHLDVDVYQGTKESVNALWPHFSVGGMIVFDDYGLYGTEGVARAVEEFAAEHADVMVIYNFNGQAVALKLPA